MVGPLRTGVRRGFVACAALLGLALLCSCVDPNGIGVQDYGTISGAVINQKNNQPIAGALVSAAGYQARTDANGGFTLRVPVGQQTVTANAAGFNPASQEISVLKNQTSQPANGGYIYLTPSV